MQRRLATATQICFHAAFYLRFALIAYAYWHDANMAVKYTDIDYVVFTDAARFVSNGESPYERATFRYTPLMAYICLGNVYLFESFGKIVFCVLDLLVGLMVHHLLHTMQAKEKSSQRETVVISPRQCLFYTATSVLFNPIVFNVSTRGNGDILIVFLVMITMYSLYHGQVKRAAFWYAISIHTKIYPVIYYPAIFLFLAWQNGNGCDAGKRDSKIRHYSFFNRKQIEFAIVVAIVGILSTGIFYWLYGYTFLYETYLYHFVRSDNRHNFSVYFYHLYLSMSGAAAKSSLISIMAFVPQFLPLLVFAILFHRDLPFALFMQTFAFVAFNKVCTAQYFVWFLPLLGFIMARTSMTKLRAIFLILLEIVGQGLWLTMAYRLEFLGENTFFLIWVAGIAFFVTHLFVMVQIVVHYVQVPFINPKLKEKQN